MEGNEGSKGSPKASPVEVSDCLEDLVKFVLESSINHTLGSDLGLSNRFISGLLKDDDDGSSSTHPSTSSSYRFKGKRKKVHKARQAKKHDYFNKPGKKIQKPKRLCYVCGKPGHKAMQCLHRQRQPKTTHKLGGQTAVQGNLAKSDEIIAAVIVEANLLANKTDWVLDQGASRHLCANKELFHDFEETAGGKCVYMGKVKGKGKKVHKAGQAKKQNYFNKPDNKIQKPKGLCYACEKPGHKAMQCLQRQGQPKTTHKPGGQTAVQANLAESDEIIDAVIIEANLVENKTDWCWTQVHQDTFGGSCSTHPSTSSYYRFKGKGKKVHKAVQAKKHNYFNKPNNKIQKTKGLCYVCGKSGHKAMQCLQRQRQPKTTHKPGGQTAVQANLAESDEIIAAVIVEANPVENKTDANLVENKIDWVLDTGVSRHFCANKELFHDFEETADGECVYMGNSTTARDFSEGVPPYPLYKHLASALERWIISGSFFPPCENVPPIFEDDSLKQTKNKWNELVSQKGSQLVIMLKSINFEIHVQEPFFSQLKDGLKTIEGRCATGDYNRIRSGDFILVNKCLMLEVQDVHHYDSFVEMLEMESLQKILPGVPTIEEGEQIYRKFYTKEKEQLNGVIAICVTRPASQPYSVLSDIMSGLGYRGFQNLLGLKPTVGTIPKALPPPRSTLLSSFTRPHKPDVKGCGLTDGARSLTKHVNRCSYWGKLEGDDSSKNRLAVEIINRIMLHCRWMNVHIVQPHGVVFEVRVPEGYGARWSKDGTKFIGFLEPYMDDGHAKKWRH